MLSLFRMIIRFFSLIDQLVAVICIKLVRFYQLTLSYWLGRQCRFYPTCSNYSIEVYKTHGGFKGSWLTVKRLLRCHPFSTGGVDLPPKSEDSSSPTSRKRSSEI